MKKTTGRAGSAVAPKGEKRSAPKRVHSAAAKASTERPYSRTPLKELAVLVRKRSSDMGLIRTVLSELLHRTSSAAGRLRIEAEKRVASPSRATATSTPKEFMPSAPPPAGSPVPAASLPAGQSHSSEWKFDDEQRGIIEAPTGARLIVNAPPGTGKTAVACGRITWLLKQGTPAHQIWLFSFTRTAVEELRNRIGLMGTTHSDVHAVKVATLDSKAWSVVQGFQGTTLGAISHDFNNTIQRALEILRSDQDSVLDMLDEIAHLIVDEAQDLVGIRGEFVMELIARLPRDAGVTVLTDDVQAIYGFAEDDDLPESEGTLPERLRKVLPSEFTELELRTIYRTESPTLQKLYIDGRRQILAAVNAGQGRSIIVVRECVGAWNDGPAASAREATPDVGTLQLYRSRMEVFTASSWLADRGITHRIRMSGLPTMLHPWLAVAFSRFAEERLTRARLDILWHEASSVLGPFMPDIDTCWFTLLRHAGDHGAVDMNDLRRVLARPRPPVDFLLVDAGLSGPILGTIHASKGREADHVQLMIPLENNHERDPDEEARVLFVGATRARSTLTVGSGDKLYSKDVGNGRRCRVLRGTGCRMQLMVGHDNDVDVSSPVSRLVFESAGGAEAAQASLRDSLFSVRRLRMWRGGPATKWAYDIREGADKHGQLLGRSAESFSSALMKARETIWKGRKLKDPDYIGPIFQLGVRAVVMDPQHASVSDLHAPWTNSGFWLAPVIIGLPAIPFFPKRQS